MHIYTVRSGDTLYAIANRFGTSVDRLTYDNQLSAPDRLSVGQALVIPVMSVSYRVRRGDTLYTVANAFQVPLASILAANPNITNPSRIYAGQTITIPLSGRWYGSLESNGYTYVSISDQTAAQTFPYLTYISPFSWRTDENGNLFSPGDGSIVSAAYPNGTAPLMTVTNIKATGGFSSAIAHSILTDAQAQDTFIENVENALSSGGYYGLNIDFEYIYPFDRNSYTQFFRRLTDRMHALGYPVSVAVAPKISAGQQGTLYESHDYAALGAIADKVIIMTYEWGYTYGPAMAVSPVNMVRRVLNYAVTEIPPGKILMGMPNYGYNWTLPFVKGTAAQVISNVSAVTLAGSVGAEIKFDTVSQAPYFNYYDAQGRQHEVWFEDARSIKAKLELVAEYRLGGVSWWTVTQLFRTNFIVLESMYDVIKVV